MPLHLHLHRRTLAEWALLTAVLASLAALAAWQQWFWRTDFVVYDTGLSLASRTPPDDVVIVAIDEESLARIGRWPWRRAIHATLMERLTEARAASVGFDIILSEADGNDPDGDRVLGEAIRRNGRVILPVMPRLLAPGMVAEGRPAEPFASAAAGLGHIETQLDSDGIFRSVYLWGGTGPRLHAQLALAMLGLSEPARLAGGNAPMAAAAEGAAYPGWQRAQWRHLRFAGPPGTFRTVSYVDVLTGSVPAEHLRNRHVLVGATATGLGDVLPTPMSELGRPMPGVEIHATVLDSVRGDSGIDWLSGGQTAVVSLVVIVLLMVGLLHLSPRDGLLLSGAVALAALLGGLALLHWGRLWLPPTPVLFASILAYPLWSWRRLEATQRFLDAELRELQVGMPDATTADDNFEPVDARIAIVRAAARRQREIQRARDDGMRFISHDLRSPLASIITVVEAANSGMAGDAPQRFRQIGRYAQRALDLADDFFKLSKAEALDSRKFEIVDLGTLAQEACDEIWNMADRKAIRLRTEIAERPEPLVSGDRSLLLRALTNLIGNAVKYSPERTTVTIRVADKDGQVEFAVEDQGFGIADEDLPKLFTRYSRLASPQQPAQPGVGLGLVIVKTIVERHGGSMGVTSRPGLGSTFTIRLPCGHRSGR